MESDSTSAGEASQRWIETRGILKDEVLQAAAREIEIIKEERSKVKDQSSVWTWQQVCLSSGKSVTTLTAPTGSAPLQQTVEGDRKHG